MSGQAAAPSPIAAQWSASLGEIEAQVKAYDITPSGCEALLVEQCSMTQEQARAHSDFLFQARDA